MSTAALPSAAPSDDRTVVPVFFLSDSTGISAEIMGNALLIQFPELSFERNLVPFIATVEMAREVVAQLDEAMAAAQAGTAAAPLVFCTAVVDEVRAELLRTTAPVIDLFGMHMARVEELLGVRGLREARRLHGVGDVRRYNDRMAAVEFAIEHDDGQTFRAIERADVILLAPSRCGKTPTAMYLALQHGLFVANYPLVDEDLETTDLPRPVRDHAAKCFGLTTTVTRLSRVRQERRANSRYASEAQCRFELRQAGAMYHRHKLPTIDTSSSSVEEIAAVVLQTLKRTRPGARRPASGTPGGKP
ncbi:pyruvate, water dikinase regulatory protein [Klenkia sp. PcliD-1-E]|uniref:pyruvate, water dikinase regulatory protein n=1 Tax=Klenkia sp. PcliD-1-E TaxID=2954492 RepID=UPI002097202D|nr:pyruvate, phosphate dikinase/phosphoenolpyruvate synthase regulator [Klenkia sp. PcliD-1-E]MCO7218844.1 pyruvate, phosphate dikinase/phosphoenolpyruvate synthase regulator [Klenkia sp. PcliD-1-E]